MKPVLKVKRYIVLCFSLLVIVNHAAGQPKIILKLDDIGVKNNVCNAAPVIDVLMQRKIKAGLGVIAMRLDSTTTNVFKKYLNATNAHGDKLFEIWNHGLYHNDPNDHNPEFKNRTLAYQQTCFAKADKRVLELTGAQMHSFGAPNNAVDSNTIKVILAHPNYKVIMLNGAKEPETNGIANYNNRVNMENGTGQVNYEYFVSQYESLKSKYPDYIIMQGHPPMWDTAKIREFNKILDYLAAQKCEFVLPYDYYLQTHKKQE